MAPKNQGNPDICADDMYDKICREKFVSIEKTQREHTSLLTQIREKVFNGLGDRLTHVEKRVDAVHSRIWAILVTLLTIAGGVIATLVILAVQ